MKWQNVFGEMPGNKKNTVMNRRGRSRCSAVPDGRGEEGTTDAEF